MNTILPTTLVGSYPQPDWLIDRAKLAGRLPPRVRAKELWRIAPEWLEQAQDDATLLAIWDQERAGLDIIADSEMRRESYSNRFATALDGVDIDNPGTALDRSGHPNPVPRVVGRIRRRHPVQVRDVAFLRANTDRTIKITVPGAFTMAQQAENDFYKDEVELAMDYAAAVNEEIKDLFAAGADVVQIDEPYLQARPAKAKQYGVQVLNHALEGITGTTAVHICFGYAAIIHQRPSAYSFLHELEATRVNQISIETAQSPPTPAECGVLDLADIAVETPAIVADRYFSTNLADGYLTGVAFRPSWPSSVLLTVSLRARHISYTTRTSPACASCCSIAASPSFRMIAESRSPILNQRSGGSRRSGIMLGPSQSSQTSTSPKWRRCFKVQIRLNSELDTDSARTSRTCSLRTRSRHQITMQS
jgi:5-methyltetrahydropteroyltriglutamate--homocysteine methyltransferase